MIVTMTSLAPVRALRKPAMPPHTAPPTNAPITASSRCSPGGRSIPKPTKPPTTAPRMIWPWAPMLNRPARKPMPSPRPAKISGAENVRVSVIGRNRATAVPASGLNTEP